MPRGSFHQRTQLSPFKPKFHRVPGDGPLTARIMLIGERPGEEEASRSRPRPFVGLAGKLLNVMLTAANLERKDIYITNLVKDFRDYEKPTKEEIARDWPELCDEIRAVQPEIIGMMGTYAVEALMDKERAELDRTHGVPTRLQIGLSLQPDFMCTLLPMFHPAAGMYAPEVMGKVLDDFLRLAQLADGEITVRQDEWAGREQYLEAEQPHIVGNPAGVDTEGSRKNPWCVTWSSRPGTALLHRGSLPRHPVCFANKVYLHSALHDLGVLRAQGVHLRDDQFTDTMVMAYLLCIEPQGLKALAYRHCAMEMQSYQDVMWEADQRKALEYLEMVSVFQFPDPEPFAIVKGGVAKITKPQNMGKLVKRALADIAADKRDKDGEPVNPRKRWNDWEDYRKEPVVELLGDMPTATLDDIDPGIARHYACRDADATLRLGPILEEKIAAMGLEGALRVDLDVIPMLDRMQTMGIRLEGPEFWSDLESQCYAQMGRARHDIYLDTGAKINPASGDQVAELLYGQLGLTPPKMTDSGKRGSTNDKCLESLLHLAPVVEHVASYRSADKIRAMVKELGGLAVTGDRRVHTTLRTTRVETGRLASADPNLLGIPINDELGKQIRAGFIASDGYVIGDWDLDQIEMRLMAHESNDRELCKLFWERRDIHAETACRMFSVAMSQLSVDPRTGKVNDYRRMAAKHAGFGIINGITAHGLADHFIVHRATKPDGSRWTVDDCEELLRLWFEIYPGVKRYQNHCIEETRQTGLGWESISGRIVYLPAIWSPIKWVAESAERMSYVMHTQGGAQALLKRAMKKVWDYVCREGETEPLLQVHDEIILEVRDDHEHKEFVSQAMVHFLTTTTPLRVPVLASGGYGDSWLSAH